METKNERLIQLRQAAGWTQQQLAEKVGLSQSMIAFIEAGKKDPSRKYRMLLARIFGVSVEWLFYERICDFEQVDNEHEKGGRGDVLSRDERIPAHS